METAVQTIEDAPVAFSPVNKDYTRWLKKRMSGIGASDAASVLDESPWKSRYALYQEKIGSVEPDDLAALEHIYWGSSLEPAIRARVRRELEQKITYPGKYAIQKGSEPYMLCTLDGVIPTVEGRCSELFPELAKHAGPGVLQIKTTNAYSESDWRGDWPLYYQIQVMHELAVTGYTWGILAILIGGQIFRMFPFRRNKRFIEALISEEKEFWRQVTENNPPPVDGSNSTTQVVSSLYPTPKDGETEVLLCPESVIWDREITESQAKMKELEKLMKDRKNKIRAEIGDNTFGVTPDGQIGWSWKVVKRKGFTVQDSESRVLRRVSKRKVEENGE